VTKTQDDRSTTVAIAPGPRRRRKDRESELARMLGDRASKVALSHARELLDGASRLRPSSRSDPVAAGGSGAGRSPPPRRLGQARGEPAQQSLCFHPVITCGLAFAIARRASSTHASAVCPPIPVEPVKPAALEKLVETGPGQIATHRTVPGAPPASSAMLQCNANALVAA
jgi:hypothetical protein